MGSTLPTRADQRRVERLTVRRARGMRSIFDQPQLQLRENGGRTVRLVPNAVVAEERYLVPSLRKALDSDVTIGAPFRIRFPAGALLLVRAGDASRAHCLLPWPAPRDERGIVYPDVCLVDGDGDGRYERARFQPENPDRDRPRDFPIAPAGLRTLPPADQPGLLSMIAEQRLRVIRVARDGATVIVESRLLPSGVNLELPWSVPANVREIVLRLEDGATARLAGLQLRASRDPSGAWQVATEGRFDDWLKLREGNTVIDTGAAVMGAQ